MGGSRLAGLAASLVEAAPHTPVLVIALQGDLGHTKPPPPPRTSLIRNRPIRLVLMGWSHPGGADGGVSHAPKDELPLRIYANYCAPLILTVSKHAFLTIRMRF